MHVHTRAFFTRSERNDGGRRRIERRRMERTGVHGKPFTASRRRRQRTTVVGRHTLVADSQATSRGGIATGHRTIGRTARVDRRQIAVGRTGRHRGEHRRHEDEIVAGHHSAEAIHAAIVGLNGPSHREAGTPAHHRAAQQPYPHFHHGIATLVAHDAGHGGGLPHGDLDVGSRVRVAKSDGARRAFRAAAAVRAAQITRSLDRQAVAALCEIAEEEAAVAIGGRKRLSRRARHDDRGSDRRHGW